jgi:acetoin utilization deacetylase AcuC-like enzyme
VNVPLEPYAGAAEFRAAWSRTILPALGDFRPDFILVSAGFDAHADDPLASLELREADYAWVTAEIGKVAKARCGGRIVSALEGGYDIRALAASTAAHVAALMAA